MSTASSKSLSKSDSVSESLSISDDPDIFPALGDSSLKKLKRVLKRVLPSANARRRTELATCLHMLSIGKKWTESQQKSKITWHHIQAYKRHYPAFAEIFEMSEVCREAVRQLKRKDALDSRGVDGWEEPVFHKGVIIGYIKRYSDKCLELGLKASDPERYSDRKAASVNLDIAVSFQSVGVDHATAQPNTIDITGKITEETVPNA